MRQHLHRIWVQFRNPDYTGTARRMRLTGLNVGLGVGITAWIATFSRPAAVIAALGATLMILFRGYAVPGTGVFLEKAETAGILDLLSRGGSEQQSDDVHRSVEKIITMCVRRELPRENRKLTLVSAGVIDHDSDDYRLNRNTPSPTESGLSYTEHSDTEFYLTDSFREDWLNRMQTVRSSPQASKYPTAIMSVNPEMIEVSEHDDRVVITQKGEVIGWWVSTAAFSADITIGPVLAEWVSDWEQLDRRAQAELISNLRSFLKTCPGCGTELDRLEDVTQGEQSGVGRVSITCTECGSDILPF